MTSSLEAVLVLSRHGVRGPYGITGGGWDPSALEMYSDKLSPFPSLDDFGINETAQLTPNGAANVVNLGRWFAGEYEARLGWNAEEMCGSVSAYVGENQRDNETAKSFLVDGIGCDPGLPLAFKRSPAVFNQGQDATLCQGYTEGDIVGTVGTNSSLFLEAAFHEEIERVGELLGCCTPLACGFPAESGQECTIMDLPRSLASDSEFWHFFESGPFATAAYFAQLFELEFANGMETAHGEIESDEDLMAIAGLTAIDIGLANGNYWSARAYGSTLAAYLAGSLQQIATGESIDGIDHSADDRLIYFAGHDVNQLFVQRLLQLSWQADGWQPNAASLGGMLVFEVSRDDNDSDAFVSLFYTVQGPQTLHDVSESTPPQRVPVAVPGCSDSLRCSTEELSTLLIRAVDTACIEGDSLASFAEASLKTPDNGDSSGLSPGWTALVGVACLTFGSMLTVAAYSFGMVRAAAGRRRADGGGGANDAGRAYNLLSPADRL